MGDTRLLMLIPTKDFWILQYLRNPFSTAFLSQQKRDFDRSEYSNLPRLFSVAG